MKKLILTEKPSVAREIARVLGCKQNQNGAIIGNDYVVTWALGHLVTLALPEEMNKEWEKWQLETLPMIPGRFETRVIKETSKQYSTVKNWLKSNEISELIIATDAGREGELVARWIINKVGFHKPMKRLWISSMTDKSIRDGFNNLKNASNYDNLYQSAESRAIADWLVGLNVTRALTCKYNAQLSAGRVQTPTLAMIVNREEEINKFVPKEYYQIIIRVKGVDFIYQQNGSEARIFDKDKADQIFEDLKRQQFVVSSVTKKEKRELPPLLYDLTSLQQDANRLYGFSAKMTLDIIQKLYENDKYLTYPRTDSKYLSTDMYGTIKERLNTIVNLEFQKFVKAILSKPINRTKRIFDDSKISDHHAIIITEQRTNIGTLSPNDLRIYNLVVKRFLSAFLDDYVYNQTIIEIKGGNYTFKTSGRTTVNLGWRAVYQKVELGDEEEATVEIPQFTPNEKVSVTNFNQKKGLTKAPDRYTEATLLSAMEHPGKFITDSKLQAVLEQVSGIGTPATRAEIIERIISAGYVVLKGRSMCPTEKGKQLIKLVPKDLKSPELTALWELRLAKISEGKENKTKFIVDMEKNTETLIKEVLSTTAQYRHENATKEKCPTCGKNLLEVSNKFGKSLVCMDRECGFRKNLSRNTNFQCPNCHKKMSEIASGEKQVLICTCGYKESKERFLEKLGSKKGEMNKHALDNYLRNQKKDIPQNNPFLDAFNLKK